MRYQPDDHDMERSHELERRLDRDFEREPYRARAPRRRPRQFRYWAGVSFRPIRAAEIKEAA